VNPLPYDDQTYGTGRNLDAQKGRLYGHMKREPIFLRPTAYEFWMLLALSLGAALLVLLPLALILRLDALGVLAWAGVLAVACFVLLYLIDALNRWRRKNYRYEMPR